MLAICFSIAAFQLVIPYRPYDLVLQVGPLLWLAAHRGEIKAAGRIPSLAVAAVWVSLGEYFIASFFISILHLVSPTLAVALGLLPVSLVVAVPFTTLTAFTVFLWKYSLAPKLQEAAAVSSSKV